MNQADVPNLPCGNPLSDFNVSRDIAAPHRLHQEQLMLAGISHDFFQFPAVHSERLLTQHSLAGAQRKQCVLFMKRMRCPDIDGINLRVVHQFFIGGVCNGNAVILGEFIRAFLGT
ncbi:hypothetical protein D3C75_932320 [compost metagenome]